METIIDENIKKLGKADVHMHSNFSDGQPSIEKILDYVENKTELDIIAITDHDTIKGALKARKIAKKRKFRFEIIIGEEVSSIEGHIVALFIKKRISPGLSAHDTLLNIKKQGGIAVLAHPFYQTKMLDKNKNTMGGVGIITTIKEKDLYHGIEVINGTPVMMVKENNMAQFINHTLLFKSEIGASDAHILKGIGKGFTMFEGKTAKDLKEAILTGQTRAMSDKWDIKAVIRLAFFFIPEGIRLGIYGLMHYRENRKFRVPTVKLKRFK